MLANERGGADTLVVTLFVVPLLLFVCFSGVPFFVYIMKANHLQVTANHALKEAEAVGYVSQDIMERARVRLTALGLEPITRDGVLYPSFAGSTAAKVLRDAADPTVMIVVMYPAPNVTNMLNALGSGGGDNGPGDAYEGLYRVVLYGKSETYDE